MAAIATSPGTPSPARAGALHIPWLLPQALKATGVQANVVKSLMAYSQPEECPWRAASGCYAPCSLQRTGDGSKGHCFTADNPRGHSRDPSNPFSKRFLSSTTWDPSQEERDQPEPTTAHHSGSSLLGLGGTGCAGLRDWGQDGRCPLHQGCVLQTPGQDHVPVGTVSTPLPP